MEFISTNFPTKGTLLFLLVKEPVCCVDILLVLLLDLARFLAGGGGGGGGCTAKFALPFKTPPASATAEIHIG